MEIPQQHTTVLYQRYECSQARLTEGSEGVNAGQEEEKN